MKLNPALATQLQPESTEPSDWLIRANQGHSINVDSAKVLAPITREAGNVPETIVHGSYFSFYPFILESGGLSRMSRSHIHFSTGVLKDGQKAISGMRKDAEILIYVDINASINDGIQWWVSENGVILTTGNQNGLLPIKYFTKIVSRNQDDDIGLLWKNGSEIKKLPESFKSKWPIGKSHLKSMIGQGSSTSLGHASPNLNLGR